VVAGCTATRLRSRHGPKQDLKEIIRCFALAVARPRLPGDAVKILCSYCSADKDPDSGLLPAIERYRSERLRHLWHRGQALGVPLYILSGRFGLLAATDPIPWYDHLLPADEAEAVSRGVAGRLRELSVTDVEYHTADIALTPPIRPYLDAIRTACTEAGACLTVINLNGNPP
jgi:hypothetical protein